jgi:hypothetical protein
MNEPTVLVEALVVRGLPLDEEGPWPAPRRATRDQESPGQPRAVGADALHGDWAQRRWEIRRPVGCKSIQIGSRQRETKGAGCDAVQILDQLQHVSATRSRQPLVFDGDEFQVVKSEADDGVVRSPAFMPAAESTIEPESSIVIYRRVQVADRDDSMIEAANEHVRSAREAPQPRPKCATCDLAMTQVAG